ncbi:MAG TPA: CvpA family protein [Acidimicrobiia bacterium]|nr:CvpA family protein [Acidimicrobiia bacterium]
MIDFLLGAALAGLVVRGWVRGLVRELLDLVGLVLGAAIAFRLSGPIGDFVTDRFGVTSEWARLGAGVLLFVGVGLALGLVARALSRVMELPGLNLTNRVGGAGFAAAWGVLLLTIVVAVAGVLPVGGLDDTLAESRIVGALTGPESLPSRILATVAGRPIAEVISALEDLVGGRRVLVDGDERVKLEPVEPADYALDRGSAEEVFGFINEVRLGAGINPLPWSEELAVVAALHAEEMYRNGYLSHVSPVTGRVADRVAAAGIGLASTAENIGLAATTRAVHEEMVGSVPHRARMLSGAVDRVGVATVAGPYGIIVVEVFGG